MINRGDWEDAQWRSQACSLLGPGMRLRAGLKDIWSLFKQAVGAWSDDYAPSMGAALSYYTLFSIAPLLLIVIAVAGWFFGDEAARGELTSGLHGLMGEEGAKAVESMVANASKPKQGIIASVVGVFVLILGATTVFGELQNSLDRIWRAPAREKVSGLWRILRARLLSIGMILGIAFLLMVSLVLDALLHSLGRMWGTGAWEAVAQTVNTLAGFGLTTAVFALIYKLIPRATIEWHDVWVGAAVTALLFTVGKFLIGLYIGRSAVASSFGAAGSLVVVMIWVYYSAQIFLLGAEFTWVYSHAHGSRRGQKRPGAAEAQEAIAEEPSMPAPVRIAPAPLPPLVASPDDLPVHRRKPLLSFGLAAAIGAIAGVLFRAKPDLAFHRSRPRLFSRW
ncbi:MAG TPA: YihY/virulence factor BrkB family protein [Burkholderiales bacterium]|nr:YihY/virulence factor BrkB family protein [Burkholderiales bacterium]